MMIMQSPNEQERFEFAKNLIIDAGDLAELNGRPIAPRDAQSLADGLTYLGCNPRLGRRDRDYLEKDLGTNT